MATTTLEKPVQRVCSRFLWYESDLRVFMAVLTEPLHSRARVMFDDGRAPCCPNGSPRRLDIKLITYLDNEGNDYGLYDCPLGAWWHPHSLNCSHLCYQGVDSLALTVRP